MDTRLFASVYSDKGTRKTVNQDNFFLNGKILHNIRDTTTEQTGLYQDGVFAVCDGMGGESDGEIASRIAVDEIGGMYQSVKYPDKQVVWSVISGANQKICDFMKAKGEHMGSTMVMAVVQDKQLSVYNIGDSRCYLVNKNGVRKLTKDHTLIAQMVESGMLTEEQAKTDRRRHQLVQHLGILSEDMTLSPYYAQVEIFPDDVILLCSDGLTDTLDENAIRTIILHNEDINRLAYELVSEAKGRGSTDNITAMVIKVRENPLKNIIKAVYLLSAVSSTFFGMFMATLILLLRLLFG